MASPAKNNAALSQLGNLYQYLTVLKICLEAPAGAIINLEQFGDITTAGYQFEIKHHDNPEHVLVDTHVDFWKTLKNWVDNYDLLKSFSNLVLLTSSIVRADSLLGQWNAAAPNERYSNLKTKADEILAQPNSYKTIIPFIQKIFAFDANFDEKKLASVLARVTIKHSSDGALKLYNGLVAHIALSAIPNKYRANMVRSLLGMIAIKGITATGAWDIERDEVHHFLITQTKAVNDGGVIYYPDIKHATCGEEIFRHRCIEQIKFIPFEKQVLSAAQDYYYYTLTVGITADNDPFILKEFQKTEEGIGGDLDLEKATCCLDLAKNSINETALIKASRQLYVNSIKSIRATGTDSSAEAKKFNSGMLHSYVNTSEFCWRITELDVDD
ncbi:hypothetical protein [Pseudomonas prosekii]|uniref:hypothetical protein n=1 Tax=Pseudomonas prosekii TaxID=1148509 RepID=UPI0011EB4F5B|nr:hypothetical protein [Pseudomonas prosekii]